jgi:nitrite reductase/ring-hydroxylating ferredoxin subunit
MTYLPIAKLADLPEDAPAHADADGIDLVLVRRGDLVHVFEGRCPHRGALLADGRVEGANLICGVHGWDYRLDSGVSAYNPAERIYKFSCHVVDGEVRLTKDELVEYRSMRPERRVTSTYDRLFDDPHQDTAEEPYVGEIHALAKNGLSGAHGTVAAMGVPRDQLPSWDDLQVLTAQLHRFPMLDDEPVDTAVTIGPAAARPLRLDIPVFVSDMSFGALSAEAKTALGRGAEGAGTAICSGEGGMLPEEKAECSRYLYELASGRFGWDEMHLDSVQALHLKLGQGAKTGTGGHLPGNKVTGRIAEVRGLPEGTSAVSPARFTDWTGGGEDVGAARGGRPRRGARPGRRLRHPRRPRRRHRRRPDDLPGHHQRADDGRARASAAPPRPGGRPQRHARGHRRLPPRPGHGEGVGAGRRRDRGVQRGVAGHRLRRHARLSHRQLPDGHRHPEAAPARPAPRAACGGAAHPLTGGADRADGGAGARLRPRLAVPLHPARPDELEARGRRPGGRELRRRREVTSSGSR